MRLMQLVYASHPFGFDELTLTEILLVARRLNQRDDITGSLICREDLYLQMLEGPRAAVTAAYERISRDQRHTNVVVLWAGDAVQRLFPGWEMRDDPAQSWMWTREEVSAGAVTEASAQDVRDVFVRLASQPYVQPRYDVSI
jgi:Sensors of blue-light using FAD